MEENEGIIKSVNNVCVDGISGDITFMNTNNNAYVVYDNNGLIKFMDGVEITPELLTLIQNDPAFIRIKKRYETLDELDSKEYELED
jgi:hypothetical protein